MVRELYLLWCGLPVDFDRELSHLPVNYLENVAILPIYWIPLLSDKQASLYLFYCRGQPLLTTHKRDFILITLEGFEKLVGDHPIYHISFLKLFINKPLNISFLPLKL